jgi:hypothetical protein
LSYPAVAKLLKEQVQENGALLSLSFAYIYRFRCIIAESLFLALINEGSLYSQQNCASNLYQAGFIGLGSSFELHS